MEINQVKFGNYSIGNPQGGASKKANEEASEAQQQPAPQNETKSFNVDDMFNAMNIVGMQAKAQINKTSVKEVNPADYLSDERIDDIGAMMAEFELGVDKIAQSIEEEFPNMFSQDQKNALAATVYAAE